MSWQQDLEEARRRLADLDVERELASALQARASSRWVTPQSEFFLPLPPVARAKLSLEGGWTEQAAELDWMAERVDLDAAGRPVAHILGAGSFMERTHHLWFWDDDGSFWEIQVLGFGPFVRRFAHDYVVTAGPDDANEVRHLTWRDGYAVRADVNGTSVVEAEYAPNGTLERVVADGDVVWDGRTDPPEPVPDDLDSLVEPLAVALDGAVRAVVASGVVAEPFAIQVLAPDAFPPVLRVVSVSWRDGIRRSGAGDTAAIEQLYKAVESGHGAEVGLTDLLDAEGLRLCRVISAARFGAYDVVNAIGERLAELLHATPVPGATDPFLALVELGHDLPGFERARRTAPDFERFMASIASTREGGESTVTAEEARRDRDALERYLATGGLEADARRLARELAEDAFLLVAGEGRSRLGGPALLPPDTGRPELTFLAGIDLSELPPSRLPDAGWLLFFAAVDSDEVDFDEPGAGLVLYTREPVEAPATDADLELRHVVGDPHVVLPYGWGVERLTGLDPFASQAYEELVDALWEPFRMLGHQWLGGHVPGAQFMADDTGTRLLFHIESDDGLGFEFLDAGTLQFRIAPGALAERDWSQVVTVAESC
jgi:hypothetical protein